MLATASAARMKSISSAAWRSRSERRIRNSSPPCRATTSIWRIAPRKRDPTAFNNSSPAACPKLSLTSLKLSRSMNRTAAPLCVRAARVRANSRCSRNEVRFARPVNESWSAAWASFSIASASIRLRSVMSATTPSTSMQPSSTEPSGRIRSSTQRVWPSQPMSRYSTSVGSPRPSVTRAASYASRSSGCTAASYAASRSTPAGTGPSRVSSPTNVRHSKLPSGMSFIS